MLVLTLLIGVSLFYIVGPLLETRWNPVYRQVIVTQISKRDNAVKFIVSGLKARACPFAGIDVLSFRENQWKPATMTQDPEFPLITTPAGHQVLGSFWVEPAGSKISIETRHSCHGLWTTVTRSRIIEVQ